MFCAIPTPFSHVWEDSVRSLMIVMFPLVGTVIGLIWTGVGMLTKVLNVPVMLAAAVMALIPYLLTGGIHLDGYMDTCDAVFSRRPLEKKREILKDSHVGSFAVVGLAVLMMLGFSAFASAKPEINYLTLVFICTVSRCCSAIGVSTLRPMGHSEYAGNFQKGISRGNIAVLVTMLIAALCLSYFVCGISGIVSSLVTAFCYCVLTYYAFKNLYGFSGDVTGFGHTLAELCGVITLVLF